MKENEQYLKNGPRSWKMEVWVSMGGLPRHESPAKMMVAWFDMYHVVTVVVLKKKKKKKKRRVTMEMGELVTVKMELRKGMG